MQINQPDPETVVARLRYWLNAGPSIPNNLPMHEQKFKHNKVPIPMDPGPEAALIAGAPQQSILPDGL